MQRASEVLAFAGLREPVGKSPGDYDVRNF